MRPGKRIAIRELDRLVAYLQVFLFYHLAYP
jgi:hypothetical protein